MKLPFAALIHPTTTEKELWNPVSSKPLAHLKPLSTKI